MRVLVRDLNRVEAPDGSARCRVLSPDVTWDNAPAIHIAVEAERDATAQFAAAESIIERIRERLRGDSTMAGRLTALIFRHVIVVLVFRGQLLTPDAFVFNILRLQDDRDLTPIDFIPRQLPQESLQALGLSVSQDPLLAEATLLVGRIAEYWAIAAHSDDLLALGSADDEARAALSDYVERLVGRVSTNFEEAAVHMHRLSDWASTFAESQPAVDLGAILHELWSRVVPAELGAAPQKVSIQDLAASRERLEEARNLALMARLKVADLALKQIA